MTKIGSILYLPPPKTYPSAAAIVENLKRFPPKYPLIVYSDHQWKWPDQILLPGTPECVKGATDARGMPNQFAINNLVFLTGLRIAQQNGLTHIIYVEADCRVGCTNWDEHIFNEYFRLPRPTIAAGTLATYNPCNHSAEAARRWQQLVARNTKRNVPVATYGWVGASQQHPSCVFPNGALSVLDVDWMQRLFALDNTVKTAGEMCAWDMALGKVVWDKFGVQSYDVLGFLECIYSGYGDILTTQEERLQMLRDGKAVAVHQVKGVEQP